MARSRGEIKLSQPGRLAKSAGDVNFMFLIGNFSFCLFCDDTRCDSAEIRLGIFDIVGQPAWPVLIGGQQPLSMPHRNIK